MSIAKLVSALDTCLLSEQLTRQAFRIDLQESIISTLNQFTPRCLSQLLPFLYFSAAGGLILPIFFVNANTIIGRQIVHGLLFMQLCSQPSQIAQSRR